MTIVYVFHIDEYSFNKISNTYPDDIEEKDLVYLKSCNFLNKTSISKLGHILLKIILKQKYNINHFEITYNDFNKPYLKNENIYFSISNCKNHIAIAFSDSEIGLDIEDIRPYKIQNFIKYLKKDEVNYIYLNKTDIYKRFFEIWTKKEAKIKYKGTSILKIRSDNFNTLCDEDKSFYKTYKISNCILTLYCEDSMDKIDIEEYKI